MAYDKVVDASKLDENLTSVADAIRTKSGTTGKLTFPDGFVSAVEEIQTESSPIIQPLSITENGTYEAPVGVDGYNPVTVAIESGGGDSVGIIYDTENIATAFGSPYPKKVEISLGPFSVVPSYTLFGSTYSGSTYDYSGLGLIIEEITFSNCNAKEISFFSYAFHTLSRLKKITLPSNTHKLYKCTFYNCTALSEVTFGGTPSSMNSAVFGGCSALATINVPWAEGAVANAPWGATNATINYNYTGG